MKTPLLQVTDLVVEYGTGASTTRALNGVSVQVESREVLGLVGESGSGKSTLARAVIGLLGSSGRVVDGSISFQNSELSTLNATQWRKFRGSEISIVLQNPMTSLNPVLTIGKQLGEALLEHADFTGRARLSRMIDLLSLVGLPTPRQQLDAYPHQLSGGMRQRVSIAMAISCEPKILLADEITTALDVTVQAQIVGLLQRLREELDMAILLVSHDLGVVANLADRVSVMHSGRIVENGTAEGILSQPQDAYTKALIAAVPRLDSIARGETPVLLDAGERSPIVAVDRLSVTYPTRRGVGFGPSRGLQVVHEVSLDIQRGETVGLVGESGCGKSSLGRAILRLGDAKLGGSIVFQGSDIANASGRRIRPMRGKMQMIFQDPYSSLDPRLSVSDAIKEALVVHSIATPKTAKPRIRDLLELVGLPIGLSERYPHELSGGQVQRVAIARALAVDPDFLICDEPTSALDVSTQAQIMRLLHDLQDRLGVSYLFISHNLAVVRQISQRIAVMYLGTFVEWADRDELFGRPLHPYTQSLLVSVLSPDVHAKRRSFLQPKGDPPNPASPPSGCRFHTRCPFVQGRCRNEVPLLEKASDGHFVACHFWREIETQRPPAGT